MQDPLQPPPPYDDFSFNYEPARNYIVPSPPSLPPSAGLFSQSETTDFFGFLDNFSFDIDNLDAQVNGPMDPPPGLAQRHHQQDAEYPPSATLQSVLAQSMSLPQSQNQRPSAEPPSNMPPPLSQQPPPLGSVSPRTSERRGSTSSSSSSPADAAAAAAARSKALLTTPQKRLNHIMSEQKRRNAIRDGYVQLTTLLAPAGAPPGAGMPTRGRPKGSGARGGRGRGTAGFKGKSGILFRAVEYIHWLEEGRDALQEEVAKVEAAAGIQHP